LQFHVSFKETKAEFSLSWTEASSFPDALQLPLAVAHTTFEVAFDARLKALKEMLPDVDEKSPTTQLGTTNDFAVHPAVAWADTKTAVEAARRAI